MAIIGCLKMRASSRHLSDYVRNDILDAIDELEKYRKIIRLVDTGRSFLNHLDCVM